MAGAGRNSTTVSVTGEISARGNGWHADCPFLGTVRTMKVHFIRGIIRQRASNRSRKKALPNKDAFSFIRWWSVEVWSADFVEIARKSRDVFQVFNERFVNFVVSTIPNLPMQTCG